MPNLLSKAKAKLARTLGVGAPIDPAALQRKFDRGQQAAALNQLRLLERLIQLEEGKAITAAAAGPLKAQTAFVIRRTLGLPDYKVFLPLTQR